eukprot:m.224782 g.224782  ORF g.224782 m.224782 type:complete len:411 (-) comp16543_c0_seq1:261-1493(-)
MAARHLILALLVVGACARAPIVVLNGVAGTVVYGKLNKPSSAYWWCDLTADWYRMWISVEELAPKIIDCLCEDLAISYDPTTDTYYNAPGVQINASSDFGGFGAMAYLDPSLGSLVPYMAPLVSYFVGKGYTVGQDLLGAPYDWRLAADAHADYFSALKNMIESAATSNGAPVVLVAHSMGGLMALKFLQGQSAAWKQTYIKAFVPIDAPWGGAVTALMGVISGYNFGISEIPHDWFRALQVNTPSMAWFMPVPDENIFPSSRPLVWTRTRNYSAYDLGELFADEGLANFPAMYRRVAPLLFPSAFGAPLVPTHIVYGYNLTTICGLLYANDFVPNPAVEPSLPLSTSFQCDPNGDETVNIASLQRAEREWAAAHAAAKLPLTVTRVPNMEHMEAVGNAAVLALIESVAA